MAGRPRKVRIGGRSWALNVLPRSHEDLGGDDGKCHYRAAELAVANDQSSFDERDTALHEVMHAIRCAQGREYGGKVEEDYVRSLATGLMAVFADNPGFAAWLTDQEALA